MSDKPTNRKQSEQAPAPERRSGVKIREQTPEAEFGEPHSMMGRPRPVEKTEAERVKASGEQSER